MIYEMRVSLKGTRCDLFISMLTFFAPDNRNLKTTLVSLDVPVAEVNIAGSNLPSLILGAL